MFENQWNFTIFFSSNTTKGGINIFLSVNRIYKAKIFCKIPQTLIQNPTFSISLRQNCVTIQSFKPFIDIKSYFSSCEKMIWKDLHEFSKYFLPNLDFGNNFCQLGWQVAILFPPLPPATVPGIRSYTVNYGGRRG